ncbi:restriction endonuclease subunit S [Campylobacter upsaliensis]|nr:restriction endonuclease subunit S [Campylobacter upsaliensis]EDP8373423.1 restriction endonuclease subunit S [Campylobacter upsaliensis]EHK5075630.1 restriction endonuclease subunit S [Campylobacter upsaliensis]
MKPLNDNAHPLESLLQQHCPNGVEFKELGELGEFSNTGVDKKKNEKEKEVILLNFIDVMKNHYIDEKIPTMIVTASDNKIKQCTCEKGDIFITPSSETIDEIGFASVITKTLSNTCYSYHIMRYRLFEKQITTSFFIRYLFESEIIRQQIRKYATGLTRFGLKKTKWEQIKIPLPPLEIQQKIVDILDAFTELQAELQAELHARRKQYEYYRNKLLSFEELQRRTDMLNGGGLKLVTLGEIGTFTRGNGLTKSDFVEVGVPCIHYGQIHTHYHNYTHSTTSFVSEEKARKLKKAKCGDLVIAGVSEDKDCVCKAVVYLGKQEACVSGDTFIFSHSQNPKFIGYMFQTENFNTFKHKYAQGAKVLRVHNKHLENFQIPLPPLAVQNEIVELLDKFDTLTNDLTSGIPAEIEARKKQYEYYRERLLSFIAKD